MLVHFVHLDLARIVLFFEFVRTREEKKRLFSNFQAVTLALPADFFDERGQVLGLARDNRGQVTLEDEKVFGLDDEVLLFKRAQVVTVRHNLVVDAVLALESLGNPDSSRNVSIFEHGRG